MSKECAFVTRTRAPSSLAELPLLTVEVNDAFVTRTRAQSDLAGFLAGCMLLKGEFV